MCSLQKKVSLELGPREDFFGFFFDPISLDIWIIQARVQYAVTTQHFNATEATRLATKVYY